MTRVFIRVLVFVAVIDCFFMYIGQTLTQSEQHPPPQLEITPETDHETLVGMGEELVTAKGGCLICHKIAESGNERGPDLRGVGGRAPTRVADLGAEAYLLQSLQQPSAYLVEGFPNIMPVATQPPADLTATELKAVVAFLQSMGGEVTVQVTPEDVEAAQAKAATARPISPGLALMHRSGCTTCHDLEGETRQVGPPLTTVANRLTPEEIRLSILEPDSVIAEGYPAGLMPKDLAENLTDDEIDQLITYLEELAESGTLKARALHLAGHPLMQMALLIFLFNAGSWIAITWLEEH